MTRSFASTLEQTPIKAKSPQKDFQKATHHDQTPSRPSEMVTKDRPQPQPKPGPGLARSVDREIHNQRLEAERRAFIAERKQQQASRKKNKDINRKKDITR